MSMGDRKRDVTLPLYDADYLFAVNVLKNLYLGPGKPGPEDEWKVPLGPIDEIAVQDDETAEPAHSGHRGLLHRLTHGR